MKKLVLLILLSISTNVFCQCDWNSFFPFQIGNSKFDVARIKSSNPTVQDTEDKYGMRDAIAKINNGFKKYDYLKDSVYINVINLRFVNNTCFKGTSNRIQLTLSEDKLHKATIELNYADYDTMKKQYDKLLGLVPENYGYEAPFELTNRKTNEKTGEGVSFSQKLEPNSEKLNNIDIGYKFDFKLVYDKKKKEHYRTNEIESYTIEINVVDLRQSKLTRQGY